MPELTYPIETERLSLRPIERTDVPAIHAYQSLDIVAKYQFWEPRTLDDVSAEATKWVGSQQIDGEGELALAVDLRSTGNLIGDVIFRITDKLARQGSIGFTFHPAFQGKGYATEAAYALLELGFDTFSLHRIFARCDARNTASWSVMERLGMRREAHFREHAVFKGGWDEEFYYAVLEREWREQRARRMG
jgi:RimJ/RimL family protein N-acetyltransferase